jgi:hypothetical protein
MKNNLFFLLIFSWSSILSGQTPVNATFFAEAGERFWIIIDGQRQNELPQARVEVVGLTKSTYRVKVIFDDDKLKSISQTITTRDFDEKPVNSTYVISNKHPITGRVGKMRLRLSSYDEAVAPKPVAQVPEPVELREEAQIPPPAAAPAHVPTEVSKAPDMDNGQVTININLLSTNERHEANRGDRRPQTKSKQSEKTTQTPINPTPVPETPKCPELDDADFNVLLDQIKNQSFENTKLRIANNILLSNCLKVSQIKSILALFSFEKSKVDFAKSAYGRAVDPNRYFMLHDAFSFSASVNELNAHIEQQQK